MVGSLRGGRSRRGRPSFIARHQPALPLLQGARDSWTLSRGAGCSPSLSVATPLLSPHCIAMVDRAQSRALSYIGSYRALHKPWYLVLGTRFLALSTWHLVLGTWYHGPWAHGPMGPWVHGPWSMVPLAQWSNARPTGSGSQPQGPNIGAKIGAL